MSAQILLQGRLLGTESYLLASPADKDNRAFEARLVWLALLGEVLPRALLADLKLPALPPCLGQKGGFRHPPLISNPGEMPLGFEPED